ncbi:MAG: PEP-CTERM sorting domain-containing protein [Candidatus Thiodiazotropha sp.]
MKRIYFVLIGIALFAMTGLSSAGILTDTVYQNVKLGTWQSHSYTHNLIDDGFIPGTAVAGTLSVDIFDDRDIWPEIVVFTVEAFDFDSGGFTFGSQFVGDLEVNALSAINSDGLLDVTVTSLLGDFYVGNSVLTVTTRSVPAPSVLLLLSLGLMGLGTIRRLKT